jgi:hypothetical protein
MDYQASTSSSKEIIQRYRLRIKILSLFTLFILSITAPQYCFADDPTQNPLTEDVIISATVLQGPTNTPTPPSSAPFSSGSTNQVVMLDAAIFRGLAYPGSTVSLLKNGTVIAEIPANADGTFDIRVRDLAPGTYSFGVRAQDANGLQSKMLTFTVYVSSLVATTVDGIFIPPTITSDKIEVMKGNTITFTGKSAPDAEVRLSLAARTELLRKTRSDSTGAWFFELDSSLLDSGDYEAKARSLTAQNLSPYSDAIFFRVGDTNRVRPKSGLLSGFRKKCDLNNDNRVNLLDFSIMAFWYKRISFPPKVDLNTDKQVNLTDLSILAFCWTG